MNVRTIVAGFLVVGTVSLALVGGALAQQEPGRVGSGPPEDIFLRVTIAADGAVTLSPSEFTLAWGGYYRFNILCPPGMADGAGLGFDAPEFIENAHVRIFSIADTTNPELDLQINLYLQGRNLGKIECEGLSLTPRFSFHPMRRGTYPFRVVNGKPDPDIQVTGQFIVQ